MNNIKKYKVAVIGATGAVGSNILSILAERNFPISEIHALASAKSQGKELSFGDDIIPVKDVASFDFKDIDIAFFAAGSEVSKKYIPSLIQKGVLCIDKASCFRLESHIPLVVPEVNPVDIEKARANLLITSPNCVAIPISLPLAKLMTVGNIKKVFAASYQSVSGKGQNGNRALYEETKASLMGDKGSSKVFDRTIAFNVIPQIGPLNDEGISDEEFKVVEETKKILSFPTLDMSISCVRVPVFVGHSIALHISYEENVSLKEIEKALSDVEGITYQGSNYSSPYESAGEDEIFVGRARKTSKTDFACWIASDNLRKGAALNAVQIAEKAIEMKVK